MSGDADRRPDLWSTWLLRDRHVGDPDHEAALRAELERLADRVLDGLPLAPGCTLLDVGTGDGLLALRAIERIGPRLRVVLTDISPALLRHAEARAVARGVAGQCRFIEGSAERLARVADASVDALATRAVLAYVADKAASLDEFRRVLKPGGRLSLGEPLLQDEAMNTVALREVVESGSSGVHHATLRLLHKWKSAQFPDTAQALAGNPLVNYSERELLTLVRSAGFEDIHLELHIDVRRSAGIPWRTFLASSPHPWAPTLDRILAERFDAAERVAFEQLLRPSVESGRDPGVGRLVYLTARRP